MRAVRAGARWSKAVARTHSTRAFDTPLSLRELSRRRFVIAGPNVIESEEHALLMARELKACASAFDATLIFKASWDKANRTTASSYRGVSLQNARHIFSRVRRELGLPVITDIHEPWQAAAIAADVDVLQIPAFLCRQTDLLEAAADTGLPVHIKKGQFASAAAMHKSKEKVLRRGNPNVILCERGTFFGYQDLVVDPRNLISMRSEDALVSMDLTHSLQRPAQQHASGAVSAGGDRELVPWMGRVAAALEVHGIFVEVHDEPERALCDAPTQWPLARFEWLLDFIGIPRLPRHTSDARGSERVIPGRPLLRQSRDESRARPIGRRPSAAASDPTRSDRVAAALCSGSVATQHRGDISPLLTELAAEVAYQLSAFGAIERDVHDLADEIARRHKHATIYLSAVGKSQASAHHLSALLKSLGIRSFFIDCTNALHGDLGAVCAGDLLVVFSKSGGTAELLDALPTFKGAGCYIVSVCCEGIGHPAEQMAARSDRLVRTPFSRELSAHLPSLPTSSVLSHMCASMHPHTL